MPAIRTTKWDSNVKKAGVCFCCLITEPGDRPKRMLSPFRQRKREAESAVSSEGGGHCPLLHPMHPSLFDQRKTSLWVNDMRRLVLFHSWPPKDSFAPLCSLFPSCFAAGHRPSEAQAQAATQRDGRSHIIDWTLDKRSWGPSSAMGSSAVRKPLSIQPHTHMQTHTHTHCPLHQATWGISRACKQANHSVLFPLLSSLFLSHRHTHSSSWVADKCQNGLYGIFKKIIY